MDLTNNWQKNNKSNTTTHRHGGNLEQEAQELGYKESEILDASASLVPFAPPKELLDHLNKVLNSRIIRSYPDRDHFALKKAIATCHQINPEMVLPGNGAAELITWSARNAAMVGLNGLLAPCFSDYERALNCWGGKVRHIPMPLTWSDQQPQAFTMTSDSHVIWITNPHNPTGQLWSQESLLPLLEKHDLVICDEAFLPLVPSGDKHSLIPFTLQYKNLIVIRSLTKLFGIAGLRLGYAISAEERLREWQEWRDPWPMNCIAINAGIMLMKEKEMTSKWILKIHKWIKREGAWLQSNLQDLPGIKSHPSSTNFHLIEGNKSLLGLRNKLAKNKILTRDCRSFINLNSNWLRISLQKRSNNKKILRSIKRLIKESEE